MKRTLRFIAVLIKMKLQRQMTYRLSFFGATFVDGSLFLLWLVMFEAIYGQVGSVGGIGRGEMTVFLGTFSLLNAINMTLYFFGVIGIPGKIRSGDLDHYVTKPVNPLLRITFENIDIGSAPLIPLSIGMVLYGVNLSGVRADAGTVFLYILFVLLMTVLYYDLELILRTLPFFFVSTGGIERIEGAAFDLCMRVPGSLFRGVFRVLFMFLLPYGILATVPALILTRTEAPGMALTAAVLSVVFTAGALWFWRFGLKHYKSASS